MLFEKSVNQFNDPNRSKKKLLIKIGNQDLEDKGESVVAKIINGITAIEPSMKLVFCNTFSIVFVVKK